MLFCAIDGSGNIQKYSLGASTRENVESRFPAHTVVELRSSAFPPDLGMLPHLAYIVVLDDTDPEDTFYKFEAKSASDRWSLEITGPDTIDVQGTETYTVKKVDGDGVDLPSGTEEIEIQVTRGLLSAQSVTLVDGEATFDLTAVNETVSSEIKGCYTDKVCPKKVVNFVLGA